MNLSFDSICVYLLTEVDLCLLNMSLAVHGQNVCVLTLYLDLHVDDVDIYLFQCLLSLYSVVVWQCIYLCIQKMSAPVWTRLTICLSLSLDAPSTPIWYC